MQQVKGRREPFLVKTQVKIYAVFSSKKLGITGKLTYLWIMIQHYTTNFEKKYEKYFKFKFNIFKIPQ